MPDQQYCDCCDGDRCCCGRESMTRLRAENKRLREGLRAAAQSLETIAKHAGYSDANLEDLQQVRGYANSRSMVAFDGLRDSAYEAASEEDK